MNLLYIDRPLVINPYLAKSIGLNEAIILQQLNYWLTRTESGVLKNGKVWVYNTYAEWQEQVPFFSERTIQRIMLKLERMGVVESEMLNKSQGDRTKFYTINQDHDLLKASRQNGTTIAPDWHHHSAKLAPSSCQTGMLSTETTTETTTDIKSIEQQAARPASASRFEEWWKIYPVKRGKKAAQTTWRRKKLDRIADDIIADTRNRIANDGQWLKGYIPHGSTYVSQEVWLDDTTAPNQPRPDIIDSRDICNACGAHRNDCVCWAENLHEDLF